MIAEVIWGAGLVFAIEGLVLAVAPGRIDAVLDAFRQMPSEARRLAGMAALAVGLVLLSLSRVLSG